MNNQSSPIQQTTPQKSSFYRSPLRNDHGLVKMAKKVNTIHFWQDCLHVLLFFIIVTVLGVFTFSFITGRSSKDATLTGVTSQGGAFVNKPFSKEGNTVLNLLGGSDTETIVPDQNKPTVIQN